tara:strand:+ start:342 stop:551 length:210 start_codon:yes stop_codon:yes gene_type:complete
MINIKNELEDVRKEIKDLNEFASITESSNIGYEYKQKFSDLVKKEVNDLEDFERELVCSLEFEEKNGNK